MAAVPKISASLLLLRRSANADFEVLMIQRRSRMTYSNSYVFPGGMLDPSDSASQWQSLLPRLRADSFPAVPGFPALDLNALRIAAVRETYEEVRLFVGEGMPEKEGKDFVKQCVKTGAVPAVDKLVYFLRFVTPMDFKARFDTTFFVADVSGLDTSINLQRDESKAFQWLSPLQALNQFESREMKIYPPQLYSLYVLSHITDLSQLPTLSSRVQRYPILPCHKHVGGLALSGLLPGDELYELESCTKRGGMHRINLDLIEGLSFQVSQGHNTFLDHSPVRVFRKGKLWLREPASSL